MAEKDEAEDGAKKEGGKKKIILILVMLLLLGVGTGGTLYFTGMLNVGSVPDEEQVAEERKKQNTTVPIYFAFPQPFTVNFETERGLRFLQVSMELMTYDPLVMEAVQMHLPVITNDIILILSNQSYGALVTLEGKEEIRGEVLAAVRKVLEKYHGKPGIEEVYFTSFVMQ